MEEKDKSWWKLETKKFFLKLFLSVGTGITALIFVVLMMLFLMKACSVAMEKSIKKPHANRAQNSKVMPGKIQ